MSRTSLAMIPVPAAGCDCASCPFFTANPAAVEPICSGCNTSCAYCGCERMRGADGCHECPIRCGSRIDITDWMRDVGGTLLFDDIQIPTQVPAGLPAFVPQVDGHDIPRFDAELAWPAYAVGLRRVLSPKSHRVVPKFSGRSAHDALRLDAKQLAVLVGYGEDPLVEAFWTRRHELAPLIAEQGWDLVLACNYSMYGNQPRAEHLLNFRRNLLLAHDLNEAGVPAVPNLYWFRPEDLERYEAWITDTSPAAVAVNLQTFRKDSSWQELALPGLAFLADALGQDCRVILTGTSRRRRIRQLHALFGDRLVLVSQNPLQFARHGAVMTAQGREDAHAHDHDAFAANVRYYASLLEGPAPSWALEGNDIHVLEDGS